MSLFSWCTRRAGGISIIALLALCYWVISRESTFIQPRYKDAHSGSDATYYSPTATAGAGIWAYIFAYYALLIHAFVFVVPFRACWGLWHLNAILKQSALNSVLPGLKKLALQRRDSQTSVSSSTTLASSTNGCSSTSVEFGDADPEVCTDGVSSAADNVTHAIIIPNYKEELDTLKETLEVLASHPQAYETYDVYLGMEQREQGAESKALGLIQEFSKKFRSIGFTLHPSDIPGEAAGKGSNIGWAARQLSERYLMGSRKDVIVTGIDADSHLSSNYFALITNMHLAYPETASTTMYSAPIIFDRNAHNVPAIVRVADILWSAAGMSGLYRGSSIAPPTSVYSLSLELVDRVGGWDCDGEAIGEDLHMYLKCFFALNGNLTTRIVNSPVSQSNVSGGGRGGIRGFHMDLMARYKQAIRHMWGSLDTGYALRKVVEMWQERKLTSRAYQPLHRAGSSTVDLTALQNNMAGIDDDVPYENGIFSSITKEVVPEPDWERVFYLFHRLFEAHFLPVHMTIMVIATTLFVKMTEGKEDPHSLSWVFQLCNVIRVFGLLQFAFLMFLYESYHRVCVETRERDMTKAGLSDGMRFSRRTRKNLIDYLMVPLVGPLYGAIPCTQAQMTHFWNLDLVYTVSKKATRRVASPPTTKVDDMA